MTRQPIQLVCFPSLGVADSVSLGVLQHVGDSNRAGPKHECFRSSSPRIMAHSVHPSDTSRACEGAIPSLHSPEHIKTYWMTLIGREYFIMLKVILCFVYIYISLYDMYIIPKQVYL